LDALIFLLLAVLLQATALLMVYRAGKRTGPLRLFTIGAVLAIICGDMLIVGMLALRPHLLDFLRTPIG
jgi:hypothetical protein